jgi:hypothetical protein
MSQEPSAKGQDLNPFESRDRLTDVTFVVEGKTIYFNKAILSVCSPVFSAMFTSEFAEKNRGSIELPGKKHAEMVEFFKHIHPIHAAATKISGKREV